MKTKKIEKGFDKLFKYLVLFAIILLCITIVIEIVTYCIPFILVAAIIIFVFNRKRSKAYLKTLPK